MNFFKTNQPKNVAQILAAFTETVEQLKEVSTAQLDTIALNEESIAILQEQNKVAQAEQEAAIHAIKKINSLFI